MRVAETSHDAYQVGESCSGVSLRVPVPREAGAHPLALPLALVLRTLTVWAVLPGAAPQMSGAGYACLAIYINATTLKDAGVCQRKEIH